MATVEERVKILQMVQDGKINANQGVQLLEALEAGAKRARPAAPPTGLPETSSPMSASRSGSRWFRVQVTDTATGKTRVNVRLPVGLVNAGVKMGARFAPQIEEMDPEQLMRFLNSGETGKIIDIYNEDDGEHVEVFIE